MIERTCQACGKTYQTFPSLKPKYCSQACAGVVKKRGKIVECMICQKPFYKHTSRPERLYCSHSCATTARNLSPANPSYSRDISGDKNPMFGKGRSGTDNPMYGQRKELASRWNGGGKTRKDGYILVIAPDDHPYPAEIKPSGTKYILAHRLVMEQALGRYLDPQEVVHHIDENPSNNALSNLRLYASQSEHIADAHSVGGSRAG